AIQFRVKGEFDVAYFVDGKFIGYESNYYDGTYETWSESRQDRFLDSSLIWIDGEYTEVYTKEEVSNAIGMQTSGEANSGVEA
ncbi:MAG: hypothetical protein K2L53_00445, partial [Clostridia bacterium]|nr:hypothetical protein [Clostridia bacterium]